MKRNQQGVYVIKELDTNNILYVGSTKQFNNRRSEHKRQFKKACEDRNYGTALYRYMADKVALDKSKYVDNFKIHMILDMPDSDYRDRLSKESLVYNLLLQKNNNLLNKQDPINYIPVVALKLPNYEYVADFDSINAASVALDIPFNYIKRVIQGMWTQTNDYTFCKKEEYTPEWRPRKKNESTLRSESYMIEATNIQTGDTLLFNTIQEAATYILKFKGKKQHTIFESIRRCINGVEPSAYGYAWKLLVEDADE